VLVFIKERAKLFNIFISDLEKRGLCADGFPHRGKSDGGRIGLPYPLFSSIHRIKIYPGRINLIIGYQHCIFVQARTKYPNPPKAQIQILIKNLTKSIEKTQTQSS